jgi:hypothetical protein
MRYHGIRRRPAHHSSAHAVIVAEMNAQPAAATGWITHPGE